MLDCSKSVIVPAQVESAFEFAEMCRDVDYHNFLFSMKASNPLVMVQVGSRQDRLDQTASVVQV